MANWLGDLYNKYTSTGVDVGPLKNVHAGSWFGLPDVGATEFIKKTYAQTPTVQQKQSSQRTVTPDMDAQQQAFQTLMDQQRGSTGNGMPSNAVLGTGTKLPGNPEDTLNKNLENANNAIDQDYNTTMGMLGNAEGGLQTQAGIATSQINNDIASGRTDLASAQSTQEQAANTSLQTSEKQGTSAMQQARDLFRETQQSNNAQLSALGISSSSVSEALAERLGVETARRIAGVTGSLDEVRLNTIQELGRIKKYYTEKTTQLEENGRIQREGIQSQLMTGLNQINSQKGQAANAKAQARADLLSKVQNQIYTLQEQQQMYNQQLQQWAEQKAAALQPIVQDPNYLNTLMSTANTFNQQFAPSGFTYLPEVSVNSKGQMSGSITPQKKATDPLEELYRQAGVTQ